MITILRDGFCPVVDSYKVGAKTNVRTPVLAGHLRHGYGRLLQSKMRNEMETADFEFVPKQMQNALLRVL